MWYSFEENGEMVCKVWYVGEVVSFTLGIFPYNQSLFGRQRQRRLS